ncbi:NAD(P)/FAD-dependent oxidoreductase [Ruminiclostridium herbifermentans]|uniref:NAD(P)/FAD-dependent oxidoreductase n=1 Tax=Ruminiclostridium herbifermentans TaxID=2488810 RepID=A0A4U7JEU1_9FIRM|nr:NAD(P)/FAD-dependent oxidoreductase [Ruminiclostridium herbifermentans]QNU67753.1 NAD(P)/FAD-dependent oxidoreductase [Ruminiclostridium herbifermentans]
MNNIVDLVIVGAGPAGLMAAKTAAEMGLKVVIFEKNKSFNHLKRACSAQIILDDGYENEFVQVSQGMLEFQKNNFKVKYSGPLVDVINKFYHSPNGHKIHFAHPNRKPFAVKFDKNILLNDLLKECEKLGVDIRMSTLACGGKDIGDHVEIDLKSKNKHYSLKAKKAIIAEGVNANITGVFGLNENRKLFTTAHVVKYILEGVNSYEPNSWNLYYGKAYHSNAAVIIGPSIYGDNIIELTLSGSANIRPKLIYQKLIGNSPLKHIFENAQIIDIHGCAVKAYMSLKKPYIGNVLAIGDSAAFVEVEVQGALMCGYRAAKAVSDELNGKNGFEMYSDWWIDSFEFNRDEYLQVSQGYALVPTYSDDDLDYLFSLLDGKILEGTYSQYKTPKLIWDSILSKKEKIKLENPDIYVKISNMNKLTLASSF